MRPRYLGLILISSVCAQAAISTVVNGASYQAAIAPSSWAVAFGTNLASSTATATFTDGQWPTTLGGVTIQVNGQPAELYYVSSTQINFLIPDGTTFGSLPVVITNTASGATQSATVNVQNTGVGLFSNASSGAGPGAILNGVTYAAAPFLVETTQNGGTDLRTRLAVYATGIRYAGNPTHDPSVTNVAANVTASGVDTAGNPYNFAVEYAGPAPGFIGLDQVNIVLPAQLDGAGVVTLTISAENSTSNAVTFQVNSLPASEIGLAGLSLSTSEITGGNSVTGTVSLNGLARSGGFPVSLRSSLATVTLPGIVTVPQGQASTTFTIGTPLVGGVQSATFTAQAGAATQTATLTLDPSTLATLNRFTVTPAVVQGGTPLSGVLTLTAAAPLGGAVVQLASDNTAVQLPASVRIQVNNSSSSFTIPTSVVSSPQTADLTATLGSQSIAQTVTVVPPLQMTLSSSTVTGGASVTGTITLGTVAPTGGASISLASNVSSVASVPGAVLVSGGQNAATFTITTFSVTAARTVIITANYFAANVSQTAQLTVNPPSAGQLSGLSVAPAQVTGGSPATGTITFSGPVAAGGTFVQLTSDSIFARVPSIVQVSQNQTSATFSITTSKPSTPQTVTITATSGSNVQTATLTVN